MKRLGLILIVISAGIGTSPSLSPVADINDVKIISYKYKVELPNGDEKIVETEAELTEKQYNDTYTTPIENRLKEIDLEVKAMTVKDNFDIEKPWSMYGKVIQYNYRMKLPDGSKQWINSDKPLKQEDCLKIAKDSYKNKLEGELYDAIE